MASHAQSVTTHGDTSFGTAGCSVEHANVRHAGLMCHVELNHGLRHQYVNQTFIGRRGHANESKSFAEATRLAYTCAKLDATEAGPADWMAEDSARIHTVHVCTEENRRRRAGGGMTGGRAPLTIENSGLMSWGVPHALSR